MDQFKQIHPGDVEIENQASSLNTLIESNGITVVDLLIYARNEMQGLMQLSRRIGRSLREVEEYLKNFLTKFEGLNKPTYLSASQVSDKSAEIITTGIELLDQQLSGGIRCGQITEVFGGSGSGKSHFLLQLALQCQVQRDNIGAKCIYISTESPLETRRLEDMVKRYPKGTLLDNILSIYCQDLENQDHILFTQLPIKLQEDSSIRLIVIDSIAHHLRRKDIISNSSFLSERISEQESEIKDAILYSELKKKNRYQLDLFFKSNEKYETRTQKLHYLLLLHRHLLRLSNAYNVAIVLANQVSDLATDSKDFGINEEGISLLDLDMQLGFYSGWDKRTIYKYQRMLGASNPLISSNTLKDTELALLRSFLQPDIPNKRSKPVYEDFDPRFKYKEEELKENNDLTEGSLYKQKKLVLELHYLTSGETKKYLPTLNYQWGKHMVSRIMIMKTYKPIIYDSKAEEINKTSWSSVPKRSFSDMNGVESILKGWQVQRFIKVISLPFDFAGTNNNKKISFVINKNGLFQA